MKLVTFEIDGRARPGFVKGDEIIDLSAVAPDLRSLLESGKLHNLPSGKATPMKGAKLRAPIQNPGMVLSVGMNYHEHL